MNRKLSVIFLVTKTQVLLILTVVLLTFIMEGNARFQLKVHENEAEFPPRHYCEGAGAECGVWYLLCCECHPATAPGGSSSHELSLGTSSKTCCYTVSTGPTQINTSFGSPECPCVKKKKSVTMTTAPLTSLSII